MSLLSSLINNVMGQTVSEAKSSEQEPSTIEGESVRQETNPNSTSPNQHEAGPSRECLEWKFVDFTKAKRCPIFDVDPAILKKFIGHNVVVLSISRQEFRGCCLAIDPVSLSVILATRVLEGKIRVITVPGYYLSKIRIDSNSVPAENSVSVNDLDVAELYHAPNLYSENEINKPLENEGRLSEQGYHESQESQLAPQMSLCEKDETSSITTVAGIFSDEKVLKRKEDLVNLLTKHRMPVTVKEDILEIPGVRIKPPYTMESCDTSNQMIKKKLGELIKSLSDE